MLRWVWCWSRASFFRSRLGRGETYACGSNCWFFSAAPTATSERRRSAVLDPRLPLVLELASSLLIVKPETVLGWHRKVEGALALAVTSAAEEGTAPNLERAQVADPAHGFREHLMGSAEGPGRAGEAGIQGLSSNCSKYMRRPLVQSGHPGGGAFSIGMPPKSGLATSSVCRPVLSRPSMSSS